MVRLSGGEAVHTYTATRAERRAAYGHRPPTGGHSLPEADAVASRRRVERQGKETKHSAPSVAGPEKVMTPIAAIQGLAKRIRERVLLGIREGWRAAWAPRRPLRNWADRALRGGTRMNGGGQAGDVRSQAEARRAASAPGAGPAPRRRRGVPAEAEELRPEAHLVARVVGEEGLAEAPFPMREDFLAPPTQPEPPPLLDLPAAYHDDAFVALARDPNTLWVYWDFAPHTLGAAKEGLAAPRTKMRIFQDGRLRAELDFALESRSFYVHDLEPDHAYRAEIYFIGSNGERLLGKSNEIRLPPAGPSSWIDDRYLDLPWDRPLKSRGSLFGEARKGEGGESPFRLDRLRGRGASERLISAGSPTSSWFGHRRSERS